MRKDKLIPLHNDLRSQKALEHFVLRVREGRLFRGMESPIKIAQIIDYQKHYEGKPTWKYYLHDGHHRVYGAYLCGVEELLPCEYTLMDMSYQDYLDLNINVGWVTPLDIRTHARKPDFFGYKNKVVRLYLNKEYKKAGDYVRHNQDMYLEERTVWKIKDLNLSNMEK